MHLDMLKPKVRMQRFAAGEVPKDLPEHAFEVVIEPGTRRDVVFVEPPANSVKNAYPGRIEAPFFFEPMFLYAALRRERVPPRGAARRGARRRDRHARRLDLEDRYLAEDARTSSRLAAALRELTGKKINVHNAAVSGATSLQLADDPLRQAHRGCGRAPSR